MSALGYKIYPDANPHAPLNGDNVDKIPGDNNRSAFCDSKTGFSYDSDMWFAFKIKSTFDCSGATSASRCFLRVQTCSNRTQSTSTFFRGQQTG